MGGVTRVGRGAISQILLLPKEGDLTGQEWCTAVPKSLPNTPRTGSKTERHGVQKTLVEQLLRGFLLFKTSKMVTFGHHFKNGGHFSTHSPNSVVDEQVLTTSGDERWD